MSSRLIVEGETKSNVTFRFESTVAEALRELKARVRERGYSLALDEQVQAYVEKAIRRANKELDEMDKRASTSIAAPVD